MYKDDASLLLRLNWFTAKVKKRQTRATGNVERVRYRQLGLSASHARARFEVSLTVDYIKWLIGFPEGQPNCHVANGQSDSLIECAPKGSEFDLF